MRTRGISPEEAHDWEREIDSFVVWYHRKHAQDWRKDTGFELALFAALTERNANFFRKLADFCETLTTAWADRSCTKVGIFLARKHKKRLAEQGLAVNQAVIKRLVEEEWAALLCVPDLWRDFIGRSGFNAALQLELSGENGDQLRTILKTKKFSQSVWKHIWLDPELLDVEREKGGRPRKQ